MSWICAVDGCERPVVARGWCECHYQRWRRHGDPVMVGVQRSRQRWTSADLWRLAEFIERGWDDVRIGAALGCTPEAACIARKRHGLRSRTAMLMSSRTVAQRMGVSCAKTVARWIETGLLRGHRGQQRGPYQQWYVTDDDLLRFIDDPATWHVWTPERIADTDLGEHALAVRGHVRYLTIGQVAWRCCVTTNAVNAWIRRGLVPARRYGNWWIDERDLAGFTPPGQRSRRGRALRSWTPALDRRLLDLRASGATWDAIALALDSGTSTVWRRWQQLVVVRIGDWQDRPAPEPFVRVRVFRSAVLHAA